MLHFPSELHCLFSCPVFHISNFEGCRYAWSSSLVIMTEIIKHWESQLKLWGQWKGPYWLILMIPLFLFRSYTEVGAEFMRKCPALHAEYRCEFGVLSLGSEDLWILQREVLVCTTQEGWRSTWLSIKMKDKVLSLRWWERTHREMHTDRMSPFMRGVMIFWCADCIPSVAVTGARLCPAGDWGQTPKHLKSCFLPYTNIVPLTAWIYCWPIPGWVLWFKPLLIFSSLYFQAGVKGTVCMAVSIMCFA